MIRTSLSGCTVPLACSTRPQHRRVATDPAHQPLLQIFYERGGKKRKRKRKLKCQRMGMAHPRIKTERHTEAFVVKLSGQARAAGGERVGSVAT